MECVVGFRHAAFFVKTKAQESRPYNVVSSLVLWSHGVVRGRICLSMRETKEIDKSKTVEGVTLWRN